MTLPVYSEPFTIRKLPTPDFLPAVGSVGAISLNTIKSVDPCPSNNCVYSYSEGVTAVTSNWASGCYLKDAGIGGKLLLTAGGGASYFGNEVYDYDHGTRLFGRLTEPSIAMSPRGTADPNYDAVWSEHWDKTPSCNHSYDSYAAGTPSMGLGRQGSLIKVRNPLGYPGYATTNAPHRLDVHTKVWSRAAAELGVFNLGFEFTACATAEQRKKIYVLEAKGNQARISWLDYSDGTGIGVWGRAPTMPWWPGTGGTLEYWPEADLLVYIGQSSNNDFSKHAMVTFIDPDDLPHSPIFPTMTGDVIPSTPEGVPNGGYGWTRGGWQFWAYVPTLPYVQSMFRVNLGTGTTDAERIIMPGTTITQECGQGIWKRLHYVEWLKSVCWVLWATGEMWAYRTAT